MAEYKDPDSDPVMNSSPEELRGFVKALIGVVQAQNMAINNFLTSHELVVRMSLKQAYLEERQSHICTAIKRLWANFLMFHDVTEPVMIQCDHCGIPVCLTGEPQDKLEEADMFISPDDEGWFDLNGFHPVEDDEEDEDEFGDGLEDEDEG